MAGMGDALGFIFAGAAENAAGNRAADIRDNEKAAIATAREQQLAKFRSDLDLRNQGEQNKFTADQSEKDRISRKELNAADNAAALERTKISESGANARASMAQRGEDARLERRIKAEAGGGAKGDLVQSVNMVKDQDGMNTGQALITFKNGQTKLVDSRDLSPEGGGPSANQKEKDTQRNADAEAYAEKRISETSGLFSSDAKDFKDFGGSRTKAKEFFKKEFLDGKAAGNPDEATRPETEPADTTRTTEQNPTAADSDPRMQPLAGQQNSGLSSEAQYIFDQVKKANPNASDDQIIEALRSNQQYAKYFPR